ncbi:MAG: hypothetical protein IPI37_13315 [Bacteroidales bacterium]|nr:hypothetical protein [Bacteroidales bacterium]
MRPDNKLRSFLYRRRIPRSSGSSPVAAAVADLAKPVYDMGIVWFLVLTAVTIFVTYFTSEVIASFWYLLLLVLYYRSDDEPMWLAFFLVTVDGFMGFMGLYSVTLTILPGLPTIELAQFYILLSVVKVIARRSSFKCFLQKYMQFLAYTCFF